MTKRNVWELCKQDIHLQFSKEAKFQGKETSNGTESERGKCSIVDPYHYDLDLDLDPI